MIIAQTLQRPPIERLEALLRWAEVQESNRLRTLVDPYDLLVKIDHARRSDFSCRTVADRWTAGFYGHFIAMTARYPAADRAMLLRSARRIFGVPMLVMKADVNAAIAAASMSEVAR